MIQKSLPLSSSADPDPDDCPINRSQGRKYQQNQFSIRLMIGAVAL